MRWILTLGLLLAGFARADSDWRTRDTVLEVTWQAANLVDMGLTLDEAKRAEQGPEFTYHGDEYTFKAYEEKNPLIGRHPSPRAVMNRMTLGAIAHAGISYALPHGYRDAWQYLTIGTSAYCIHANFSLGLKVNF